MARESYAALPADEEEIAPLEEFERDVAEHLRGGVWVLTEQRYSVRFALMCRSLCVADAQAIGRRALPPARPPPWKAD
jgi:hypothetical protein